MKTSEQFASVLARRAIIAVSLAIALVFAPTVGFYAAGSFTATIPTANAHAGGGSHGGGRSHGGGGHPGGGHGLRPGGPGAGGYGGARVYREHDDWWDPGRYGAVRIPRLDTTVHQSR